MSRDNFGWQIEATTSGFDSFAFEGHQCDGRVVTIKAKKPGSTKNDYA